MGALLNITPRDIPGYGFTQETALNGHSGAFSSCNNRIRNIRMEILALTYTDSVG